MSRPDASFPFLELPPLAVLLGAAWVARRAGLPAGPLLLGAGVCSGLSLVRLLVQRGLLRDGYTGSEARSRTGLGLLTGASWLSAGVFALVTLAPLLPDPRLPAAVAIGGVLWLARWLLSEARRRDLPPPRGQERHWWLGLVYVNPGDPEVLVPQRLGPGTTINLGRPLGWLLLAAAIGLPAWAALWLAARL